MFEVMDIFLIFCKYLETLSIYFLQISLILFLITIFIGFIIRRGRVVLYVGSVLIAIASLLLLSIVLLNLLVS